MSSVFRARRRNNDGSGAGAPSQEQESLLRRSTAAEDMDSGGSENNEGSFSPSVAATTRFLPSSGKKGGSHSHRIGSKTGAVPHTTEDLLAHETNFDASGAHIGFFYPEEREDQEEEEEGPRDEDGFVRGVRKSSHV
jgi:hypothetical protein